MNHPTVQHCRDQLAAFAAAENPEDWFISVDPMFIGDARLTALTVFWEGHESTAVPREAHLVFGLDGRLLWLTAVNPGAFCHAVEEGFDTDTAGELATRKLASFDDLFAYLRGQAYHLADSA